MFLSQRKFLAVCLVCSMLLFTAPKQSEAIVILITGLITVGTVIADAIILCALFCPSGGGGTSGTAVSCDASDIGSSCSVVESCPSGSDETFTGTWVDAGGSSCDCNVTYPNCPSNYCGMAASGNFVCGSCVDDTGNALTIPSDTECTNLTLPPDALVIVPPIVRKGDTVDISWNLGLNYPTNCTLEGPGINVVFTGPSDATGTINDVTVTGPHRYTLACGTQQRTEDVKLLPNIQEQ